MKIRIVAFALVIGSLFSMVVSRSDATGAGWNVDGHGCACRAR